MKKILLILFCFCCGLSYGYNIDSIHGDQRLVILYTTNDTLFQFFESDSITPIRENGACYVWEYKPFYPEKGKYYIIREVYKYDLYNKEKIDKENKKRMKKGLEPVQIYNYKKFIHR